MIMGCPTLALLLAAASASAQYVPPDESQALLDPNATYPGECPCKDKALCELQRERCGCLVL